MNITETKYETNTSSTLWHKEIKPRLDEATIKSLQPTLINIVKKRTSKFSFLGQICPESILQDVFIKTDFLVSLPVVQSPDFYGAFNRVVKSIVIDRLKYLNASKRRKELSCEDIDAVTDLASCVFGDVDTDARERVNFAYVELKKQSEELASLVVLRFYVGLSLKEISNRTRISERSLNRKWSQAKELIIVSVE